LDTRHGGSFAGVVDAAADSAVALVDELTAWPCFADTSSYQELSVPFLKRAQIAADLNRAGVAGFNDLRHLTMFADNLVPHFLRMDGVLRYAPELLKRIELASVGPCRRSGRSDAPEHEFQRPTRHGADEGTHAVAIRSPRSSRRGAATDGHACIGTALDLPAAARALHPATDASQAMPGQSAHPSAACQHVRSSDAPNATALRELKGSVFAGLA